MAYSSTNGPALISQRFGGGGGGEWSYLSTHTAAAVAASGFFTNGAALGMKVGDGIRSVQLTTAGAYTAFANGIVTSVTASSAATVVFSATST
jgi:hypothetical protein